MKKLYHLFFGLIPIGLLSACASLPHSGPSASSMVKASLSHFSVIRVSPEQAKLLANRQKVDDELEIADALRRIQTWGSQAEVPRKILPGSRIKITLWTQNLHIFGDSGHVDPLTSLALGTYRINNAGLIQPPYIGIVYLKGDTLLQASQILSAKYRKLGRFMNPEIRVRWAANGYQKGVLLSGAIRKPGFVPWIAGGLSLSRILAEAGLPGSVASRSQNKLERNFPVQVSVFYEGKQARVPLAALWSRRIEAAPGERVVVQQSAQEQLTVLGGGIARPGNYGFGGDTSLNQVIAEAGGLLSSTANDREIFVLQNHKSGKPNLYALRWNTAQGLLAAGRFPMHNGELLYVPTAPVVPLEKVVQIFSGFVMPPALLANAVK